MDVEHEVGRVDQRARAPEPLVRRPRPGRADARQLGADRAVEDDRLAGRPAAPDPRVPGRGGRRRRSRPSFRCASVIGLRSVLRGRRRGVGAARRTARRGESSRARASEERHRPRRGGQPADGLAADERQADAAAGLEQRVARLGGVAGVEQRDPVVGADADDESPPRPPRCRSRGRRRGMSAGRPAIAMSVAAFGPMSDIAARSSVISAAVIGLPPIDGLAGDRGASARPRPDGADDRARAARRRGSTTCPRRDDGRPGLGDAAAERPGEQPLEPRLAAADLEDPQLRADGEPDRLAAHRDLGRDRAVMGVTERPSRSITLAPGGANGSSRAVPGAGTRLAASIAPDGSPAPARARLPKGGTCLLDGIGPGEGTRLPLSPERRPRGPDGPICHRAGRERRVRLPPRPRRSRRAGRTTTSTAMSTTSSTTRSSTRSSTRGSSRRAASTSTAAR